MPQQVTAEELDALVQTGQLAAKPKPKAKKKK